MTRRRLLVSVAILLAATLSACGGTGDDDAPATISVSARGEVEAAPDLLTVVLGVQTQANRAQDALRRNNELAAALLQRLDEGGVAKEDMQTSGLAIDPSYDTRGRITGYVVANRVTARLRKLDQAGALIDTAAGAVGDAIRVDAVSFSIDDTSKLLRDARAEAVAKARRQADQLAAATGLRVRRVRSMKESGGSGGQPMYSGGGTGASAASDAAVPLAPGSQRIALEVKVVYEVG